MKNMLDESRENVRQQFVYKSMIYLVFGIVIFCVHIPWGYIGDDYVWQSSISDYSILDHFNYLYKTNGKILTDLLANAFYRIPLIAWKAFDTVIWIGIAYLIVYLFTVNTHMDVLITCFLLLWFPFEYISTAGYICVSTNYIYTSFCVLVVFVPIKQMLLGTKINPFWHIVVFLSIVYATNQDQSAMCLLGALLLLLLYLNYIHADKRVILICTIYLIMAVSSFIYMFLLPGHINRMTSTGEMNMYLPEYAYWTFLRKIYKGYSSTVSHIIYNDVNFYRLFCFFLFVLVLHQPSVHKRIIAFIPLGVLLFAEFAGRNKFIYNVHFEIKEIYPITSGIWSILAVLFSGVSLCSVIYTIWSCIENERKRHLLILLWILGLGSRLMMGFSPTIYASGTRTFIYFIFTLIVSCIVVLNELKEKTMKSFWCMGVPMLILALLI